MDKETIYERQKLDSNCNDCGYMERDFDALEGHKKSYEGTGLIDKLNFGYCLKLFKPVSFIPVTCQIETQHCFVHRKEYVKEPLNDNEARFRDYGKKPLEDNPLYAQYFNQ